jgi:hypothetical protein
MQFEHFSPHPIPSHLVITLQALTITAQTPFHNMYLTTAAIALGLSSLTAALPASAASNSQKGIPYVAKFDDVSAGLLANLPVRGVTALGVYDGLYYDHLGEPSSSVE